MSRSKLTIKQTLLNEIETLRAALKTVRELNDVLRSSLEKKDADHELVLNEARRRTIPIKGFGYDINFMPEHIVSVDQEFNAVQCGSTHSPWTRQYISGPGVVTIKVYGAVIVTTVAEKQYEPPKASGGLSNAIYGRAARHLA